LLTLSRFAMSFQFPFAGVMGWGNTEHLPGGFSEDNLNFTTLENVPALATDASRSNTLQPTQAQDSGSDPRATLPKGTKRRRGRNKDLDWDGVKPHLRRLYLPRKPGQKAKILDDIMKIMEEKHSFRATYAASTVTFDALPDSPKAQDVQGHVQVVGMAEESPRRCCSFHGPQGQ